MTAASFEMDVYIFFLYRGSLNEPVVKHLVGESFSLRDINLHALKFCSESTECVYSGVFFFTSPELCFSNCCTPVSASL